MHNARKAVSEYPVRLSILQRRLIAGLVPEISSRLKLSEHNQRVIALDETEWSAVYEKVRSATNPNAFDKSSRALQQAIVSIRSVIEEGTRSGYIPLTRRLYQFKITLRHIRPIIWRRIQVKNCSLDRLHEHIQTAMGWTNSHLHHFQIAGTYYGDPMLMEESFDEMNYQDSTTAKIKDVLPRGGKRFVFEYEYDFGDSWSHEVLFEGCLRAEAGGRYPLCVEGERACPPEDIGGASGFQEFLEDLTDPKSEEERADLIDWVGGVFDPGAFDAAKTTMRMRRGLPNWRLFDDLDLASR
jgi:Plasmid pRiA4b ORF-3-like protein